jgi:hypothetical protein
VATDYGRLSAQITNMFLLIKIYHGQVTQDLDSGDGILAARLFISGAV